MVKFQNTKPKTRLHYDAESALLVFTAGSGLNNQHLVTQETPRVQLDNRNARAQSITTALPNPLLPYHVIKYHRVEAHQLELSVQQASKRRPPSASRARSAHKLGETVLLV